MKKTTMLFCALAVMLILAVCSAPKARAFSSMDEKTDGSVSAQDTPGGTFDNITWTLDGSNKLQISGEGPMTKPSDGWPWASYSGSVKTVVIDEGITTVGDSAFSGFSAVTSASLPGTITKIDVRAFMNCTKLSSFTIPASVNEIEQYAFYGCAFYRLVIPEGVTELKYHVLTNCEWLSYLVLPASLTTIQDASDGCTNLKSIFYWGNDKDDISIDSTNDANYKIRNARWHVGYQGQQIISVSSSGASIFGTSNTLLPGHVYKGETIELKFEIPAGYYLKKLTADYAVLGEETTSGRMITVNEGDNFSYLTITASTELVRPDFTILKTGTAGRNVNYCLYSDYALYFFGYGPLYDQTSTANLVWHSTSYVSKITTMWFDPRITHIGDYNFFKLQSVVDVTLPESLESIGEAAFGTTSYSCSRMELSSLPEGLSSIGPYAFYGCRKMALSSLPEGLTEISPYAFYGCANITLTSLPENVTSIGEYAFYNCEKLALTSLPAGITVIPAYAFYRCSELALTSLSDDITAIQADAFYQCTNLQLDSLPAKLTELGTYTFYKCPGLTLASLPKGITTLPASVFGQCTGITQIELTDGITTLGGGVFSGCTNLVLTSLPDSITELGSRAFENCPNVTLSTLPANLQKLGVCVFNNCPGITELTIPEGVTTLYDQTFDGCTTLTRITFTSEEPPTITAVLSGSPTRLAKDLTVEISYPGNFSWNDRINFEYADYANSTVTWAPRVTRTEPGEPVRSGVCGDGLTWELDYYGNLTIKGRGSITSYTGWADYMKSIYAVKLEDGVTSICASGFEDCIFLTWLELPDSLEVIGAEAFENCFSLQAVTAPRNVTTIEASAFSGCSALKKADLRGAKIIGEEAFYNCESLTDIILGEGLISIGAEAFSVYGPGDSAGGENEYLSTPRMVFYGDSSEAWQQVSIAAASPGNYWTDGTMKMHYNSAGEHTWEYVCGLKKTCSVCGFQEGDPLGHSFTTRDSGQEATPADCVNRATHFVQCERCDEVSDTVTIPVGAPLGHSFGEKPSSTLAQAATCTGKALYYVQCDRCDAVSGEKTVPVGDPNGHSYAGQKASGVQKTAADCLNAAKYSVQCDHCDFVNDNITVPVGEPLGHDWGEADCTHPSTCSRCSDTSGEALGHEEFYRWKGDTLCRSCSRCNEDLADLVEITFNSARGVLFCTGEAPEDALLLAVHYEKENGAAIMRKAGLIPLGESVAYSPGSQVKLLLLNSAGRPLTEAKVLTVAEG